MILILFVSLCLGGEMTMTIRPIQWRTAFARPVAMPSVMCPRVHTIGGADGYHAEWLGCSHCLACALCEKIEIDPKKQTGEVECGAVENG